VSSDPESALPTGPELEARARRLFDLWGDPERLAHIEVVYNSRLRTTAGRAFPRRLQIELNPHLLARVPERLDEVLAHEAAHLVVALRHGTDAPQHGVQWSALMEAAGHPPRATHDLPVDGLRRRRSYFLHRCPDCDDRWISTTPQGPRRCGCRARIAVFRAPRTAAGRSALLAFEPAAPRG
jgi:predicted SprT family Zn-dependent metalloprotease